MPLNDAAITRQQIKTLRLQRQALAFEVEKHARERWWKEDLLVHQRITWLLTASGILGAGFGWLKYRVAELKYNPTSSSTDVVGFIVYPSVGRDPKDRYLQVLEQLANVLAGLGFSVAACLFVGLLAACWAQYKLDEKYRPMEVELGVNKWTTRLGQCAACAMPLICMFAWWYSWSRLWC